MSLRVNFIWQKYWKVKFVDHWIFFSNLEHVGWYNKFHGLKNPHFDSKIIKIEQETPEIQQYIKNTWHVSGTCRTRVGHVRLSPIYFLASRTPILTPRSSKLDKKHQRYSILSFFNKKLHPQVLVVCQEKKNFFCIFLLVTTYIFIFWKKIQWTTNFTFQYFCPIKFALSDISYLDIKTLWLDSLRRSVHQTNSFLGLLFIDTLFHLIHFTLFSIC